MNPIKQLNELKKLGSKMRLAAESWDEDWKTLIATILSARTRDGVTIKVSQNLFSKYNSVEKLSRASLEDVQKIIRPINFYKNKSKSITSCAKTLVKEYNGKVPTSFDKLTELPGVGRKTANVFLSEIGEATVGVDTHVSQISQKLGWTKNSKPEKIEEDIKKLFPRRLWKNINPILVRFGKTYTSRKKKNEILEKLKR